VWATGYRPSVAGWGGGVLVIAAPRVQLSVSAENRWSHYEPLAHVMDLCINTPGCVAARRPLPYEAVLIQRTMAYVNQLPVP